MPAPSDMNTYLWKCWRDSRSLFLISLSAVLAVGALVVYVAYDPFGWLAAKPEVDRAVWRFNAEALFGTLLGGIPAVGLLLGALGVGTEFERRTAELLLSHPRPRRWFLWTSWGLGAAQMAVLIAVSNLFRFAPLGENRYPAGSAGEFLLSLLVLWTLALVYFSLTYLMTTLARSSRNGTALAVGALSVCGIFFVTLQEFYGIPIPILEELFARTFDADGLSGSPLGIVPGWLAVSLAMTVAAQLYFERAEV